MIVFLRLLVIPVIWLIVRRQRRSRSAVIGEIEKLSLSKRLNLTWSLARDERVPLYVRPLLFLPALYMASPIDLLPDFLPVVGKLDDAFVASTAYALLARLLPADLLREHVEREAQR